MTALHIAAYYGEEDITRYFQFLIIIDKPACLIIRLLFGFASDDVQLNRNINKY